MSGPQDVALDIDSSRDVFSLYDDLSVLSVRHSALYFFLPHYAVYSADYAVARCLPVYQSLRPFVTRRYSVKTAKYIFKLFSPF